MMGPELEEPASPSAGTGLEFSFCSIVKKSKRGACEQKAATVLPNRTAAT